MNAQQKRFRQRILFYPKKNPTSMDLVRGLPKCIHKHWPENKYSTLVNEFREIRFLHLIVNDCVTLHHSDFTEWGLFCKLREAGKKWTVNSLHLFCGRLERANHHEVLFVCRFYWKTSSEWERLHSPTSIRHKWLRLLNAKTVVFIFLVGSLSWLSIFMKLKSFWMEYLRIKPVN